LPFFCFFYFLNLYRILIFLRCRIISNIYTNYIGLSFKTNYSSSLNLFLLYQYVKDLFYCASVSALCSDGLTA